MAQPGKARETLGDNYPITINNLNPGAGGDCSCDPGDSITFIATGQSCLVVMKGLPLAIPLETSNTEGVTVYADEADNIVHWGVAAYPTAAGKGPIATGTTPYKIRVGSTDGGDS